MKTNIVGFLLLCILGVMLMGYIDTMSWADSDPQSSAFSLNAKYTLTKRQELKRYCKKYAKTKRIWLRKSAKRKCMANYAPLEARGYYRRDR